MPKLTIELYTFNSSDRSNIGRRSPSCTKCFQVTVFRTANARIAGMSTDLHLYGLRYNIVASLFFVSFGL